MLPSSQSVHWYEPDAQTQPFDATSSSLPHAESPPPRTAQRCLPVSAVPSLSTGSGGTWLASVRPTSDGYSAGLAPWASDSARLLIPRSESPPGRLGNGSPISPLRGHPDRSPSLILASAPASAESPSLTGGAALGNQAQFPGAGDGLCAVARAELAEDVADVLFDGVEGDHEPWAMRWFDRPAASSRSTSSSRAVSGSGRPGTAAAAPGLGCGVGCA